MPSEPPPLPPDVPTGPPSGPPGGRPSDAPTGLPSGLLTGPPPGLPALPRRLADPTPVVLAGTGAWLTVWLVLLGASVFGSSSPGEWFWTATAGWALGLFGYGVFRWQRAAARRGSRSAQTGLHER